MNEYTIMAFIDELEKIASNPLMSKDSRHITYIKGEKDYYKTRDFYRNLGFEEETSWDDPNDKGAMFRVGKNTVIELMHDGERSTNPWRMSKRVQDVDKAHHYLTQKGVDASKPTTHDWGDRSSTAYDPVGNRLTYFTPVHTKTASQSHIIVTGHSGSGKSTLARSLSEQHGYPIVELDDHPDIKQMLDRQKEYFKAHGTFDTSKRGKDTEKAIIDKVIRDSLRKRKKHIVEGSYFLESDPSTLVKHEMHLVDVPDDIIIQQRIEREAAKRIAKGLEPDNDGVAKRGRILLDRYRPGVESWRSHENVVKHSRHTKTASLIPRKLLLEANKDKDIEGYVHPNKKVNRVAIHKDGEVVGFFTPREENGYHRVGALYVQPKHRGQGLASNAIRDYMSDKKSKVLIEDDNIASIRAHLKAGYVKGNKSIVEGMHWYVKEPNVKTASAVAVKRDPQKWEQAKQEAKAKMGGKHSARAMQLAVKIYKDKGGTYAGKKPTPANNSMRKWTKQDWQTRPGTSEIAQKSDGSTSRYLPKKKWDNLSHKEQVATDHKKLNADSQYISNTRSAKVKGNAKYY